MDDLGEKAEYLDQKLKSLVEENAVLKQKVRSLEQKLESKDEELAKASEQVNTIQLARKLSGDFDSTEAVEELKKKINQYIREIDHTLRLIGD
ncbi:MAG: hypothetical protein H6581_18050 [Bacteroidia bacterium]|nr:hypothetical protein [Bacteroidia bacterium]